VPLIPQISVFGGLWWLLVAFGGLWSHALSGIVSSLRSLVAIVISAD
jgi:hypothetical protein